jgi:hypothetical protein
LRAFALLSYPDIDLNPRCAEAEKLRGEGSRLILAATEDDTLVLDCLVPDAGAPTEDSWKPKVPVTLRAHLPDLSVTSDISRTLYCWLGTGKTGGSFLLAGNAGHSYITLPLEAASDVI